MLPIKGVGFYNRHLFLLVFLMKANLVFSVEQCWVRSSVTGVEGEIKLGNGRSLSLDVPIHSINIGQALGDANQVMSYPSAIDCKSDINKRMRYSEGKVSGYQKNKITADFDGVKAAVFDTGVDGIGFSVAVTDGNRSWVFWNEFPQKMWEDTYNGTLSVKGRYIYVLTKPLKTGVYNVPQLNVGTYDIYADSLGKVGAIPIVIPSGFIKVTAQTCTLLGPEQDNVDFGTLSYKDIKDNKSDARLTRSVTCPVGTEISVNFTLSDKNFIDNRGSYLKNKAGNGFAKGVGVEVSLDGTPIKLGPISSNAGGENQQYLGMGTQQFTLNAKPVVIPSEKATPGKLDATAVLTMSYQ
ncbi:TPA: fimbrial protein [Aeromonas salmonicida]